ncbi:MAG: prepilin-type N-terminal cleavage/methylation domain-containing protein [Minisyncoccales bacterium]
MRQREKKQNKISVVPRMVPCSSAFTLIELLVSITIFALVIGAAIGIFVSSLQGKERVNQLKEIEDNARYTMEIMTREIRMGSIDDSEANSADSEIDFTDSSDSNIQFCRADAGGNCSSIGDYLAKNGNLITSDRIKISNLIFYVSNFTDEDNPVQQKVTISMTVEAANNSSVKMNFQSTISPRVVVDKLQPNLILFWDGAGLPAGWECISCNPGDPFYEKFPMGAENYGNFGSASHSHRLVFHIDIPTTDVAGILTTDNAGFAGPPWVRILPMNHSHQTSIVPPSGLESSSESQDPPYRTLKVIQYNNGIPEEIPADAIAIFNNPILPAGFTRYNNQDNFYIKGNDITGNFGGNSFHYHEVAGNIGGGFNSAPRRSDPIIASVTTIESHEHTINCDSTHADNDPPTQNIILGQANFDINMPINLIAMFDKRPDELYWTIVSDDIDGDGHPEVNSFYKKLLRGDANYGDGGGSETHTHITEPGCFTSLPINVIYQDVESGILEAATDNHQHFDIPLVSPPGTLFSFETSSYPLCQGVIIARYLGGLGFAESDNIVLDKLNIPEEQEQGLVNYIKNIPETFLKKLNSFFAKLDFYNNFVLFNNFSQKIEKIFKNLIS